MELTPLRSYRLEFAKRAEWREEERRLFDQMKEKDAKDKRRERALDGEHDAIMDLVVAVLASDTAIASFTVKLDSYDAATVEALMENEQQLERVQEQLRIMLDKAYVLPDGRRVFKTEDGARVFDEHGQEVKDFNPDEIEDWRPRWEVLQELRQSQQDLTDERDQLHEYQNLLDETRERLDDEGLTKDELDELEKRLEDNMPDAVKRKLPQDKDAVLDNDADTNSQPASFRPAAKLDMPSL